MPTKSTFSSPKGFIPEAKENSIHLGAGAGGDSDDSLCVCFGKVWEARVAILMEGERWSLFHEKSDPAK